MKQNLLTHIKNIYGWKTKRKIVVISVDDYGNVRLDSKKARENLDRLGVRAIAPTFDNLDTLENREDLEMLFEVLSSATDMNGKNAVFTPFALPCNINFEAMAADGYQKYIYELLPDTYQKLSGKDPKSYEGTWKIWKEGIGSGLLRPQFHGREHINLKVFEEKLQQKDNALLTSLKNRSFVSHTYSGYSTIGTTAAFQFWKFEENDRFEDLIKDGLNQFENVFGYRAVHFNAPGGSEHPDIHSYLRESGIKYIDTPFIKQEHLGEGQYKKVFNYTGKKNNLEMIYEVRNVVFEPINRNSIGWVELAFKQVETAFFWNRPAIISSHRVNFCGHIDPKNREVGLMALKQLLKKITQKWPDVEFMSADELGKIIKAS